MKYLDDSSIFSKLRPCLPKKIRDVLYYRFLWKSDFPEIIHIENTNICNAACSICAREKLTRKMGFMEFGLYKKIIDECSRYKTSIQEVHLHGFGEPLLDKIIFEKIKYAKNAGINKTYFVTNASLLTSAAVKNLIAAGLDSIKFSLYGATKKTYEKIHLGLNYDEVENNIRNFFSIRKEMSSNKPSVSIQFVPQNDNYQEKKDFSDKWAKIINRKLGDRLEDFQLHNWVYARDYNPSERAIKGLKSCAIPFFIIQIFWNGDIAPCVFDFDGKMILGEIRTKSIQDIWNSPNYHLLRQSHRKRDFDKIELCQKCDQLREL